MLLDGDDFAADAWYDDQFSHHVNDILSPGVLVVRPDDERDKTHFGYISRVEFVDLSRVSNDDRLLLLGAEDQPYFGHVSPICAHIPLL